MGIILIMAVQVILAAESNAQVSNAEQYGRLDLRLNVARTTCFYDGSEVLLRGAPIRRSVSAGQSDRLRVNIGPG
jgi:hypothetical protein